MDILIIVLFLGVVVGVAFWLFRVVINNAKRKAILKEKEKQEKRDSIKSV